MPNEDSGDGALRRRDEILTGFIERLMNTVPGGVALQAWLVENKLRAAGAAA